MTVKDLRLRYHLEAENSPFTETFQLWVEEENSQHVESYIEWLEKKVLDTHTQTITGGDLIQILSKK